ncbi:hypothetical protein GCM10025795_42790 [Verticiella sediminum]
MPAAQAGRALAERERESYQRFVTAARRYWAHDMFTALRRQVAEDVRMAGRAGDSDGGFEARVQAHPTHQVFAWFERHLQRMRYSGPHGLVAGVQARRDSLLQALEKPLPEGLLRLEPDLQAPTYYTDWDIHQHPGGLGSDVLAAFVYREAVGAGVVGKPALHERFASQVVGRRMPSRVLDLGCGFGRSSYAFAAAAPQASVQGIDLAAGCVMLAAHDAPEPLQPRLGFAQADALASRLPTGSFDLVTSTMLLHEMPEDAVHALIAETGRLLAPGGMVAHLDFLPPADPLLQVLHAGHARRNNEPYLLDHSRIDLAAAYQAAGFRTVEVMDFAEDDSALADPPHAWRLPWKIILAVKGDGL